MATPRDFTLTAYELLLTALKARGYAFHTFEDYLAHRPTGKVILLRHDVDRSPIHSLRAAYLEKKLGIRSSYYFRIVKQSNDPDMIRSIVLLDHEIGYHYEDLALCSGNKERAIQSFETNLSYFRQFYPVSTICMHGSPLSAWDNRKLWETYQYSSYGITGEPYFELDFSQFLYLTDTGRRWNGDKVSVRDKVTSPYRYEFRSTFDILDKLDELPPQLMITTHPQRWDNEFFPWVGELVLQNIKNSMKRFLVNS
jgi:hypothetical protein